MKPIFLKIKGKTINLNNVSFISNEIPEIIKIKMVDGSYLEFLGINKDKLEKLIEEVLLSSVNKIYKYK